MARQVNYIALVAGILSLVLIGVSWFVPWWVFTVGNPAIATVNFSPVNFNFALFNSMLTVPLIWALNIAALLTLLAGGFAMLIYSAYPTKKYSKQILGFGYKKPLYALILFIVELAVLYFSATILTGISLPLMGSGVLQLPTQLAPGGISISVNVSAAFGWTFYLAIAVAVLCIAARLYHKRAASQTAAQVELTAPAAPSSPIAV
jgi:hypothetical protein